jgi:hypothetical protein
MFVSGTGAGDGDGAYDKSPGVKPAVGSRSPCGAVKRNDSPDGVVMESVMGLKFKSPEKAICL